MLSQVNQTEEWFYQLKGTLILRLILKGKIEEVVVGPGEMYVVKREYNQFH